MVTTRPPKTIVKPTALGPVANTDTKLLIYGLFQKGRVLAQDGVQNDESGIRIAFLTRLSRGFERPSNQSCYRTRFSRPGIAEHGQVPTE